MGQASAISLARPMCLLYFEISGKTMPSWKCQRLCNKYNLCSHASLAYMGKSRPQARDKVLPSRESQRIMFWFKTLSASDDHSWVLRRKTNWESAIKKEQVSGTVRALEGLVSFKMAMWLHRVSEPFRIWTQVVCKILTLKHYELSPSLHS